MRGNLAQRRLRPNSQTTRSEGTPAPVQGIVADSPIYSAVSEGLQSAVFMDNIVPGEYGCRIRPGSKEFATNLGTVGTGVRTIMYYNSQVSQAAGGQDFLFATTRDGIFDITAGGEGPWVPVLVWPSTAEDAGWCSHLNFTTDNGDHYLLVADEANGYYFFNGTVWAQGSFTPGDPDPEDVVYITEWANRVWFVERNTTKAWYTATLGGIQGNLTPLDFGTRFGKGGHLVQLARWTIDAGDSIDDKLVAVSSSGDVLVWEGNNPDSVTGIKLVGRWFVGKVPEGRRVMSDWGGDVTITSSQGVTQLSELLQGLANQVSTGLTKKISKYFREAVDLRGDEYGWGFERFPVEGFALLLVPEFGTRKAYQFVINTLTGAWCTFRDLDMVCMDNSNFGFFFGTHDGRVLELTSEATVDDIPLAETGAAKTIKYNLLTHYTHFGTPAEWKRGQFVRPIFIGDAAPTYNCILRYDFDLSPPPGAIPYLPSSTSKWDEGLWNIGVWGGEAQNYNVLGGLNGMGRHIAIALNGETSSKLGLIGFDLMFDSGGML